MIARDPNPELNLTPCASTARKIAIASLATLAILASAGYATEQLPAGAFASVNKACPDAQPERTVAAIGDLNGDGIPDVALVVSCRSPDDQELIVLQGQLDGAYEIAHRSEVWPWSGRSEMELEVRNNLLILSEHCAYNCNPESWKSSYKFKMHQDNLVLAGEDHSETALSGKNLEFEQTTGISTNYLTGKVIYWGKSSRRGYSEKKSAYKPKALLTLAGFNFVRCQNHRTCMPGSISPPRP